MARFADKKSLTVLSGQMIAALSLSLCNYQGKFAYQSMVGFARKTREIVMDRDVWKFVNTFAGWLSAVGTIAAVIVALYLARRDKMIRLDIVAQMMKRLVPGRPPEDYVTVLIRNLNPRSTLVTHVYWRNPLSRRSTLVQEFGGKLRNDLPRRLADGDEALLSIPLDDFEQNLKEFKSILFPFPRLKIRFLKVGAITSVGERSEAYVHHTLRNWMLERLLKQGNPTLDYKRPLDSGT